MKEPQGFLKELPAGQGEELFLINFKNCPVGKF